MIAWQTSQVQVIGSIIKHLYFLEQLVSDGCKYFFMMDIIYKKIPKPSVPEIVYHNYICQGDVFKLRSASGQMSKKRLGLRRKD